jgi:PilZ domain
MTDTTVMSSAGARILEWKEKEQLSDDRRRSMRQPMVSNAWLSPEASSKGPSILVVVCDISLNGVGFTSDSAFEKGSVFWIVMEAACLRASGRIRVVNCRERSHGGYDCGAEFF